MSAVKDHLDQFYVELQAWIDGGARDHTIFRATRGLCRNLQVWALLKGRGPGGLGDALCLQFAGAGLDCRFPFNAGLGDYHVEREGIALYTNSARLAWIKEHAEAALERRAAGEAAA